MRATRAVISNDLLGSRTAERRPRIRTRTKSIASLDRSRFFQMDVEAADLDVIKAQMGAAAVGE